MSDLKSGTRSSFSQEYPSQPKCPYTAVFLNIGFLKSSLFIIPRGVKSIFFSMNFSISSSGIFPVPNVSTNIEIGFAFPIAYAI